MKLKHLKPGQQFKFVGSDKTKYVLIAECPLIYKSVNGYIEYRPKNSSRLNHEVVLLNEEALEPQLRFVDCDGDEIDFDTSAESAFVMVTAIENSSVNHAERTIVSAMLTRDQVVMLLRFFERHLEIKG